MPMIDAGQFLYRLQSAPDQVMQPLYRMYGEYDGDPDRPADFRIALAFDSLLRRLIRPQITFYSDQHSPFKPVPASQAFPILEWGMNWCVAAFDHSRLILHAAVLEKGGRAIIFPAQPGSGKSTLTAYMALSGWNLYSDEMALIDFDTNLVSPLFRPVCLKNESIGLVQQWFPEAVMTDIAPDTLKGDVAHLRTMDRSQWETLEQAEVVGIVFPKYKPAADLMVYALTPMQAFSQVCQNAFNYSVSGARGFKTVAKLVENTRQLEIYYCDVAEVNELLTTEFITP